MSQQIKESTRVFLTELIDYAGLFPPAALSMPDAVINYASYRNSTYSWMLGRFVLPVAKLDEFLESAQEFFTPEMDSPWKLSVLAGENIDETIRTIADFNNSNTSFVICDALEVKATSVSKIEETVRVLPDFLTAYFEIPLNDGIADLITALALNKQRAKIRTGGVTADAFPSVEQITRFMRICLGANVPFKATAGLHHPVRCVKPLTYEKDSPTGLMHGFLNLFLAAAFLRQGYKTRLIQEVLEDDWAESFTFEEGGVLWRQEYFLSNSQLAHTRSKYAISFGSCSFVEPIADLQELGIL